jgi:threonyl-tRNA synthetase
MIVLGAREVETQTVSVRHRDHDDLGAMPFDDFLETILRESASRSLDAAVRGV